MFPDLDLLSKLLAPRPSQPAPLIEVIGQEEDDATDDLVAQTNALSLEQDEILLGTIHNPKDPDSTLRCFSRRERLANPPGNTNCRPAHQHITYSDVRIFKSPLGILQTRRPHGK